MEDGISDKERNGENQEVYVEAFNNIPEEFIKEETVPSVFLEDMEGDKEVWLVDCPITVDTTKLLGKKLHFGHQTSFTSDDVSKEKITITSIKEEGVVCCLLSRCTGESISAVGLQHAGKFRLSLSYDAPCSESMIPDDVNVQLPEGLKKRHPFLGPKYQEIVDAMRAVEENVVKIKSEKSEEDVPKKKKKKNKSIDASYQESVDEPIVEFVSPKKKKKHKHYKSPEEVITSDEGIKIKKEKSQESANEYHDFNHYSNAETDRNSQFSKKARKEKRNSALQNESENIVSSQDEFHHDQSDLITGNGKKRKRHRNMDNGIKTDDVIEEIKYEDSDHTSKRGKKRKSEMPIILEDPPGDDCCEIQEIKNEEAKHVKKKRKRHTMDNADIQNASTVSERNLDHFVTESNAESKKKIRHIAEDEIILLSPKKEKKIKHEYPEIPLPDTLKQKRKKDKRKSCFPELL